MLESGTSVLLPVMADEVEALRTQFVVEVGVRQAWPFLTLCDNAHTPPRETRLYIVPRDFTGGDIWWLAPRSV